MHGSFNFAHDLVQHIDQQSKEEWAEGAALLHSLQAPECLRYAPSSPDRCCGLSYKTWGCVDTS